MTVTRFEQTDAPFSLRLSEAERETLIKALYVLADNWWLSEMEAELLARLLAGRGQGETATSTKVRMPSASPNAVTATRNRVPTGA